MSKHIFVSATVVYDNDCSICSSQQCWIIIVINAIWSRSVRTRLSLSQHVVMTIGASVDIREYQNIIVKLVDQDEEESNSRCQQLMTDGEGWKKLTKSRSEEGAISEKENIICST